MEKVKSRFYYASHMWRAGKRWQSSCFSTLTQAKDYARRITVYNGESCTPVEIGRETWYESRIFPERAPIVTVLLQVQP